MLNEGKSQGEGRMHGFVRRRVSVVHFFSSLKRVVLSQDLKSVAQLINLLSAADLSAADLGVHDEILMTHRSREVVCGLIG